MTDTADQVHQELAKTRERAQKMYDVFAKEVGPKKAFPVLLRMWSVLDIPDKDDPDYQAHLLFIEMVEIARERVPTVTGSERSTGTDTFGDKSWPLTR
ncbi:MAG: hypothetical protein AMXMBFR44_3270 [Candidatus Campbellbacteria bacterium]